MATFLITTHGGAMPESEEEGAALMAAWGEWMGSLGDSLANPGAPLGATKSVATDGSVTDGAGTDAPSGYMILSADSLDAAVTLAKGCPHLGGFGGSLVVYETVDM